MMCLYCDIKRVQNKLDSLVYQNNIYLLLSPNVVLSVDAFSVF